MARRSRRAPDPLTSALAVVAALVIVALVALQLTGGGAPQGTTQGLTAADVQRIAPEAARALVANGEATLLDVRTPEEYAQAHAEGAYLYPLSEAEALVGTLPGEGALILY